MMKLRKFFALLLAAAAVMLLQTAVYAETKTGTAGNCSYTFNTSTGVLSLTGSGEMGIDQYYFSEKTNFYKDIKTVYVSYGITDVSPYAFYECSGVTQVVLPSTVTRIGRYAFEFDSKLTYVNFPEGLTKIGNGAFYGCTSLKNIDLCSTVKEIQSSAFCNTGLTYVSIPPNVTTLGNNAFGYTYSNSSYTATSGFYVCAAAGSKGYEYATNNNFGKYNSAWSFDDRTGTATIYGSDAMNLPTYVFFDRRDIKTIIVSEGLTSVGSYTFSNCYGLKTVKLPSTMKTINARAFENCTSLSEINFPKGLTTIGLNAFSGCGSLTNVNFPTTLKTVGQSAFLNTGLKSVIIPSSVTSIGTYAFGFNNTNNSYTKVSGFKIYTNTPSNAANYATNNGFTYGSISGTTGNCRWSFDTSTGTLTISGTGAPGSYSSYSATPWYADFGLKNSIEKVVYGYGVTKTGNHVFTDCTELKELTLSYTVTEVGLSAFQNTGIESFVASENLTTILHSAFRDCKKLKYVELKNGFKDLSFKAFADDTALDYIIIPDRITGFETNALDGMKNGFRVFAYADINGLGSYAKSNGYKFIKMGNVNLDSNNLVNNADAQLLLEYLSGEKTLSENAFIAAKVTDHTKSKADMRDVIQILKNAR